MDKKNNLVWVDLEMTGLDPINDLILEIAVIITDANLNIIATGPSIIINQEVNESLMTPKVLNIHKKSGLLEAVKNSNITLKEAEQEVLNFIKEYCEVNTAPLCGNSIYNDRFFIKLQMPELEKYLHYRNLDVSTVKELIKKWYPNSPYVKFKKPENHRALEDIQMSIKELEHYRDNFFIKL